MSDTLKSGHASWVWMDLTGHGARWHLAVPVEREDWEEVDDDDDETCRFMAYFPLSNDHRCEVDELIGSPERPILYPQTKPTPGEIETAEQAAEDAEA